MSTEPGRRWSIMKPGSNVVQIWCDGIHICSMRYQPGKTLAIACHIVKVMNETDRRQAEALNFSEQQDQPSGDEA